MRGGKPGADDGRHKAGLTAVTESVDSRHAIRRGLAGAELGG